MDSLSLFPISHFYVQVKIFFSSQRQRLKNIFLRARAKRTSSAPLPKPLLRVAAQMGTVAGEACAEQLLRGFRREKSFKGRTALLRATLAIQEAAPLRRLAGAGIHRVLGLWLVHGMEEEQTTFLRDVLTVPPGGRGGEGVVG